MLDSPETLQSVTTDKGSAQAVTSGIRYAGQQWRSRYQLRPSGDSWRIHSKEMECGICHGIGKCGSGACRLCKGNGWISGEETV
ncbi:MAG TPA: hypothetical protein VN673_16300 [Clostridia bacterium]|nr:hypothetical protein [Clostridia bacterium]